MQYCEILGAITHDGSGFFDHIGRKALELMNMISEGSGPLCLMESGEQSPQMTMVLI